MRLAVPLLAFTVIVLAAYVPSPTNRASPVLNVQASPRWENLQILPDSLTRDELMGVMKGFTTALGVRCHHCHVGEEGQPLSEFDFPSDANPHKDIARGMMRMTQQINQDLLPAIQGLGHDGPPTVTCATCHRGAPRPETTPGGRDDPDAVQGDRN